MRIVVFGNGQSAEVAAWYLSNDLYNVVPAFTVDGDYITTDTFYGRPVIPFEEIERHCPPSEHRMLVMISYTQINRLRERKYMEAMQKGYPFVTYIHHSVPRSGWTCGENCFILEENVIQPFVTIGDNCVLWSGNHIGHHTKIGNHVFIASHVVVSGACEVGDRAFLGVNATLRDGIKVAEGCVVGADALILHDTEPDTVHIGHEAILGRKKASELRRL